MLSPTQSRRAHFDKTTQICATISTPLLRSRREQKPCSFSSFSVGVLLRKHSSRTSRMPSLKHFFWTEFLMATMILLSSSGGRRQVSCNAPFSRTCTDRLNFGFFSRVHRNIVSSSCSLYIKIHLEQNHTTTHCALLLFSLH